MDSLQHIVATDDDDEVQLANLAVQQRRGRRRRQDSPSYAEPALERRTNVRPGEVGDATIPEPSVPAVEPTIFPQYRYLRLFTRNIEHVLGCTRGRIPCLFFPLPIIIIHHT